MSENPLPTHIWLLFREERFQSTGLPSGNLRAIAGSFKLDDLLEIGWADKRRHPDLAIALRRERRANSHRKLRLAEDMDIFLLTDAPWREADGALADGGTEEYPF